MIKVVASCQCYIGEPKWQQGMHDWYLEPEECDWEDVIEIKKQVWDDGFALINCPKCGSELTQYMDHFSLKE